MIVCLFAGTFAEGTEFPKAKVQLKIVDQDGDPVENARIFGGFTTGTRVNDYAMLEGVTDVGGSYVASGPCNEFLRYEITKEGYYATQEKVSFADKKNHYQIVDGKWQPYGETRTVVLKKIKRPGRCIPFPRRLRDVQIPRQGVWMGFDFEKSDWISPWGNGIQSDILVRVSAREVDVYRDYQYVMEVSFKNIPYGGAYIAKLDKSSDLKTDYCANTNECFQSTFRFYSESQPGHERVSSILDDASYLVYRTRTKVDGEGNLISANYGMIKGPWMFDARGITFTDGCFNPEANDLSIEDGRYLRQSESLRLP